MYQLCIDQTNQMQSVKMATTETQIEEHLGVNHPKLEAFQKAVEAVLKKRLLEADEELIFLQKENADKKKIRAEQTTALHETQRSLKMEQKRLKNVTGQVQIVAQTRMGLENANQKYEQKLQHLKLTHKKVKARYLSDF